MTREIDSELFSDTQRRILRTVLENPELSNNEVAEQTGARIALVRDTRETYADDVVLPEGEAATTQSAGGEITEAQEAILQAVSENPSLSNAAVAEQTGTRIALVRDTREAHGAEYIPPDGTDATDSTGGHSGELTAAQRSILQAAEDDPSLSNAEIAEQTDTRIALVRDTREAHGAEYVPETADEGSTATDSEGETSSDAQEAILQAAAENPSLSNAEIAERTATRIALVRDTREAHGAEYVPPDETDAADDTSGDASDSAANGSSSADGSDLSAAEESILQAAAEDPSLSNAEIAERTGQRIALVRDTREAHDETAAAADETGDDAAGAGDADGSSTDDEGDHADGELTDVQREIIQTATEDPSLSNAEIADRLDVRIATVRDTRDSFDVPTETESADTEVDADATDDAAAAADTEAHDESTADAADDGDDTDEAADTDEADDGAVSPEDASNNRNAVALLIVLILLFIVALVAAAESGFI